MLSHEGRWQLQHVVLRPAVPSYEGGEGQLVWVLRAEVDGICVDALGCGAGRQGRDQAAIYAARKVHADRTRGGHRNLDRVLQKRPEARGVRFDGFVRVPRAFPRFPVAVDLPAWKREARAGPQLMYPRPHGLAAGDEGASQVI